jgi:hypothetical protein
MEYTQWPWVVQPEKGERGLDGLERRIRAGGFAVAPTRRGPVLFRRFDVRDAADFERAALAVAHDFQEQYLGASSRESKNRYVFSASEQPSFYPIMQPYEMSFLPRALRRNFFYGKTAPSLAAGTPIADFRTVAQSLNPKTRRVFETCRMGNIRNYAGPQSPRSFGLWSLKRREQVFKTDDKSKIEAECRKRGLRFEWLKNDDLRLIVEQPAFPIHSLTDVTARFNHLKVFRSAAACVYKKIAAFRPSFKNKTLAPFTAAMTQVKIRAVAYENQVAHCTFPDGSPIAGRYFSHLMDVIRQHSEPLQRRGGDVIANDNYSMAHGRWPYSGPREVFMAWTGGHAA